MKLLLTAIIFFFATACYMQEVELYISGLPVRNGVIYKPQLSTRYVCGSDGVLIISKTDSCFSLEDGIVSSVYYLGGGEAIIVRTPKNLFVVYSNLKTTFIKQGYVVSKGDAVGLINSLNRGHELALMFVNKKSKFLPPLPFLEKYASKGCPYPPSPAL